MNPRHADYDDMAFHDAGHHFLQCFDQACAGFEPTASKALLAQRAKTSTVRAFMLVGRVLEAFD